MLKSKSIILVSMSLAFAACGGAESSGSRNIVQFQTNNGGSLFLAPVPATVVAFDRSPENEDVIVPVARNLSAQQLEVHVEPELSQDQTKVASFVTGIGVEAIYTVQQMGGGTQNIALPVRMAIRARRWDPVTESMGSEIQTFAPQGMSLDRAQEFTITDPNDPNYVMTGLGMLLREGKFSKLELKRTMVGDINNSTSVGGLSAANRIELPVGWIAVGFLLAVDKAAPEQPPMEPFISDVRIHSGLFMRTSGL